MKRQLDNLQRQAKKARTGKQQNLSRKVDTDGGDTDQGAGEGPTVKFQRKSTKRGPGHRLDAEGNKKARPTESDEIAALEEKVNATTAQRMTNQELYAQVPTSGATGGSRRRVSQGRPTAPTSR